MDWPGWRYTSYLNVILKKIDKPVEATIKTLATKDDIASVKQDIAKVNIDLSNRMSDIMKWMFIFWIGQVGTTLAIILLFLKK